MMTQLKKTTVGSMPAGTAWGLAILLSFLASAIGARADDGGLAGFCTGARQDTCRVSSVPQPGDVFANRITQEAVTRDSPFVITPHRPNYLLPLSYNTNPDYAPFEQAGEQAAASYFSSMEIKFQLSVKAPVRYGLFNGYGDLYVAYTNISWWQAYNSDSSPFRETNHEPEAFVIFPVQYRLLGLDLRAVAAGISHQSNGRNGRLSRSWNRLYASFILERGDFYMGFKPWWRIPEKKKAVADDPRGDDNPDIQRYLGYGELLLGYRLGSQRLTFMLRNNLRAENRGALQLDWSFPINRRFRGYLQYFNGYGESLVDYNSRANRLSIGVMLTDWL